jgi:hypothetical protein
MNFCLKEVLDAVFELKQPGNRVVIRWQHRFPPFRAHPIYKVLHALPSHT